MGGGGCILSVFTLIPLIDRCNAPTACFFMAELGQNPQLLPIRSSEQVCDIFS